MPRSVIFPVLGLAVVLCSRKGGAEVEPPDHILDCLKEPLFPAGNGPRNSHCSLTGNGTLFYSTTFPTQVLVQMPAEKLAQVVGGEVHW